MSVTSGLLTEETLAASSDLLRRHATLHEIATSSHEPRRDRACDTCHANKTRCSGGSRCELCVKRGVSCTFNRHNADNSCDLPPESRSSGGGLGSNAASDEGSVTETSSASTQVLPAAPLVLHIDESTSTEEHLQFSRAAALGILYRILTQKVSPSEPQTVPRAWLSRCVQSYIAVFHERWPILHAPTMNEATESVQTVATIVSIESWLQGDGKLKDQILRIHSSLVKYCYEELRKCDLDNSKPWPSELFQLCLVNIVFAFETGRDSIIRQSRMLFSLLVSCLRTSGCFQADAIESQRVTHFPGDFRPWIYGTVERWRRIAMCALKVDAYTSLLYGEPPLIRRSELELGLASTFAMWNAFGIMVFFERSRFEPWARSKYNMSQLDVRKPEEVPCGFLPEDIQLFLLGMWNDIWSLRKEAALNLDLVALKKADLSHKLYLALEQLETIVTESRKPLVAGGYTASILRSYLGAESSSSATWRQEVTSRLDTCISNIRPLLLLLMIHLHADVRKMRDLYLSPAPLHVEATAASRTWQQNMLFIQEWALSADGRTAVVASLQTWYAYESSLLMNPALSAQSLDPVMYMALSAAVTVLWAWSMNDEVCVCDPAIPKVVDMANGGMHSQPEIQNWIRNGTSGAGGAISFLGQPVCRCHAASRVAQWTDTLASAGKTWEFAAVDAALFRRTWLNA